MGINKSISLKNSFWRFLIMLLSGLIGAVIIPFTILTVAVLFGIATYADNSEIRAKEIAPIIAASPDLSNITMPMGIEYVLLDKNYQYIDSTLEDDELEQAMHYVTTGESEENLSKQHLLVTRENEYVVLQYHVGSQYTIDWLNEHIPSPDILLLLLIGINCVAVCVVLTTRFSKNMQSQLSPLFEATSEIAKQNLDFEVGHSKIKEFEDVLLSFSNMKDSLKTSLEQQWKAEQMQREQIAALAHDLKTPLTIIQGNADLISETQLDDEQRLYAGYIINSSEQMQEHIKTLIDISRASAGYQLHMDQINVSLFLQKITAQIDSLCKPKDVQLQIRMDSIPINIVADQTLLERAILNVVSNALDYAPEDSILHFSVIEKNNCFEISVTDEGEGFPPEALLHAKEQFYMADHSRSNGQHFGMGLYIANSIVEQHKGMMILENSDVTGGAKVTIQLKI